MIGASLHPTENGTQVVTIQAILNRQRGLPLSVQWGRQVKCLTRVEYSAQFNLAYLTFDDGSEYSAPVGAGLLVVVAE